MLESSYHIISFNVALLPKRLTPLTETNLKFVQEAVTTMMTKKKTRTMKVMYLQNLLILCNFSFRSVSSNKLKLSCKIG
jgi:hypothetical protein